MRILLVDHDHAQGMALADLLELAGFRATIASPADTPGAHEARAFKAAILGSKGSSEARVEHCRRLRDLGYAGAILAICASAAEGEALLDAGADDFVAASCEPEELIARLRAGLRRVNVRPGLRWGPLEVDRTARIARLRGKTVRLTTRECALLVCLIEAGGRPLSRETLRERVWQDKEYRGTNLVEVHLSRLRDKLGEDAEMIETVRGSGYRLRPYD